jgi:hypothetical protein
MEKRYAILIGSNKYKDRQLSYSIKDVSDIKNTLSESCEFDNENILTLTVNLNDERNLIELVKQSFISITQKGFIKNRDTLLFYFSGHGYYDVNEAKSYIELSDNEKVSIQQIISYIQNINPKNSYLIFDSCQSGGTIDIFNKNGKTKIIRKFNYHAEGINCLFGASKSSYAYEPSITKTLKDNVRNGYLTHFLKEIISDKQKYISLNPTTKILPFSVIAAYVTTQTELQTDFLQIPVSSGSSSGTHPLAIYKETKETKVEQPIQLLHLQEQVCSFLQSKELKHLGLPQTSLAFYNELGELILYNQLTKVETDRFYSAFTSHEIGNFLPAELEINERTLIASMRKGNTYPEKDGWRFPTERELEFQPASLTINRTGIGDNDEYVLSYRVSGASIGHKTKDSYESLIVFDNNEAKGRANLLLELIKLDYISFRTK